MGRQRADTIQDALLRARDTLAVILREFPETGPRVGELLVALGNIERAITSDAGRTPSARLTALPGRTGRKPKRYAVEMAGQEELLAEYRSDDPRPFRAPRAVFDGIVKVLARAKGPLQATETREQVGRILGDTPPEYAVRLCLRFLRSAPVGLVSRHRARYVAVERQRLTKAAADAFEALKDQTN